MRQSFYLSGLVVVLVLCLALFPSVPVAQGLTSEQHAEVDELGNVIYDEIGDDTDRAEQVPEEEVEIYVIDEKKEGDAHATLVLDELTEYYEDDGTSWYKIQLHMINTGEVPICGAVFWVSNSSNIAEAWTLDKIGKEDSNLFQLLWSYNITTGDVRYFGIITHAEEVPDIAFYNLTLCTPEVPHGATKDLDVDPEEQPSRDSQLAGMMGEDNAISFQVRTRRWW